MSECAICGEPAAKDDEGDIYHLNLDGTITGPVCASCKDLLVVQEETGTPQKFPESKIKIVQPPKICEQPPLKEDSTTLYKCSRCHQELPKEKFYTTDNYWCTKRGCSYVCKECSRASARDSAKATRMANKRVS